MLSTVGSATVKFPDIFHYILRKCDIINHTATVTAVSGFFFMYGRNLREKPCKFSLTAKDFELALVKEQNHNATN